MGMFSPQVRRTSVLRSKTLAQGEFISPEHFDPKGPPRGLTRGAARHGKALKGLLERYFK